MTPFVLPDKKVHAAIFFLGVVRPGHGTSCHLNADRRGCSERRHRWRPGCVRQADKRGESWRRLDAPAGCDIPRLMGRRLSFKPLRTMKPSDCTMAATRPAGYHYNVLDGRQRDLPRLLPPVLCERAHLAVMTGQGFRESCFNWVVRVVNATVGVFHFFSFGNFPSDDGFTFALKVFFCRGAFIFCFLWFGGWTVYVFT